ncbi:MAG: nucleotidyltransferase domain-containing protein [Nitrososphaeria archaeon]|nr:nucleotidyltransferase domain-containing protein [Nitrososphaeria archaeon]
MKEKLEYDLNDLVETISSIKEVLAVILFGSIARGDFDEYSDYDILVIFKDRESMWRNWDELFRRVGKLNLLVHCIPKSFEEFLKSEPTFLSEIFRNGKLLYTKYPFQAYMKPLSLRPFKLIVYDMSGLKQGDKMKFYYKLYGKSGSNNVGLVKKVDGIKISEGCLLIPEDSFKIIKEILDKFNVKFNVIDVYKS